MREIKFRAYIKKDYNKELVGKILEVSSIHLKTKKAIIGYSISRSHYGNKSFSFEDIELMQYTGLKDKNGKEIYEGDIIRKLVWNEQKYMETNNGQCYSYAKIAYIEELAGFYIVNTEEKVCWELGEDKYGIEVCGNIYDNPDLLKEE